MILGKQFLLIDLPLLFYPFLTHSYIVFTLASSKNDRLGYRLKDARVMDALEGGTHGGTLVIADTHAQVLNKACKGKHFTSLLSLLG